MTNYVVKCDTLFRLSNVCKYFKTSTPADLLRKIDTIRLENVAGHSYAIASNQEIGVIEYLGPTQQPDGACHLKLSPEFREKMRSEKQYGTSAVITTIPMAAISMLQTPLGLNVADCCHWFDETPLSDWRHWKPFHPLVTSAGAMLWDLHHLENLFASSPSGQLIFPEHIDAAQPVVLRDRYDPNWVGVFIPSPNVSEGLVKAATIPEWWI